MVRSKPIPNIIVKISQHGKPQRIVKVNYQPEGVGRSSKGKPWNWPIPNPPPIPIISSGRGRGRVYGTPPKVVLKPTTSEQLDAELDTYMQKRRNGDFSVNVEKKSHI